MAREKRDAAEVDSCPAYNLTILLCVCVCVAFYFHVSYQIYIDQYFAFSLNNKDISYMFYLRTHKAHIYELLYSFDVYKDTNVKIFFDTI